MPLFQDRFGKGVVGMGASKSISGRSNAFFAYAYATSEFQVNTDIGNGVLPENVDKLCYLGYVLDADGGCDSAVTVRVRSACVRSCLMHGSETWPMKVVHELELNRTEMSITDVRGLS